MDLSTLKMSDTGTVELVHPVTGPTGVVVTLKAPHTKLIKAKLQALAVERMKEQRRNIPPSIERMDAQGLDLLAVAVESWTDLTDHDAPYPCTEENVRDLLGKNPWIREQIEAAFTNHSTFLRISKG